MMKRFFLAISAFILLGFSTSYAAEFDRVIIFGDSLSDTGNLYKRTLHIIPKSPPYYKGHFSNNQVWSEKLIKQYFGDDVSAHLENYAVGGAGAILSYKENLPYTLWAEVNAYLHWYGNEDIKKSLHIVWIGANNYLNGPTDVDGLTTSVVDGIKDQIENLITHDARMIVVGNLPDIGKSPSAHETQTEELLSRLIEVHNQKLLVMYEKLKEQYPEVTFGYFDAWHRFNEVEEHPALFGLSNVDTPCYNGGYFLTALSQPNDESLKAYLAEQTGSEGKKLPKETINFLVNNPETKIAVKNAYLAKYNAYLGSQDTICEGDMFWDTVHPTTYVHHYIAQYFDEAIRKADLRPAR